MKYRFDKRFHPVHRTKRSVAPNGDHVVQGPDNQFYQIAGGQAHAYSDPNIGDVHFMGRTYIRTEATSYVRDGVDYTVYLPSEDLFITRGAMQSDKDFRILDHSRMGRFEDRFVSERSMFGRHERVSVSHDLLGNKLITRANGEILTESNSGELKPYRIESQSIDET